jgi:hypothetical protein
LRNRPANLFCHTGSIFPAMKKPLYERRAEAGAQKPSATQIAIQQIKSHNQRNRSGAKTLMYLLRCGQLTPANAAAFAEQPLVKTYLDLSAQKSARTTTASFLELVKVLSKYQSDFLDSPDNALKVRRLAEMMPVARQAVTAWRPTGKSAQQKLLSLQRHLFRKYKVPAFMENAFLDTNSKYAAWYIRWTNGHSPRSFEDSPMPVSRRMAHELWFAPAHMEVGEALRWAQARSLGATEQQATAITQAFLPVRELMEAAQSRAFDAQHPQIFAESVIRFLVMHESITLRDYGPIVDYVFDTKYTVNRHSGRLELEVARPGFSMKGRTPAALIRDVNEWHRTLQVIGAYRSFPRSWQAVRIADFEHIVGTGEKSVMYAIRQLNKQSQLYEEGNVLNHCVASYIGKCIVGSCSIWTLESYPAYGAPKKMLTIELDRSGSIVQVRGKNNRLPTPEEISILGLWMNAEGLRSLVF